MEYLDRLDRYVSKEDIQIVNKYIKLLNSISSRNVNKSITRYPLTHSPQFVKWKDWQLSIGENVEYKEPSHIDGGSIN